MLHKEQLIRLMQSRGDTLRRKRGTTIFLSRIFKGYSKEELTVLGQELNIEARSFKPRWRLIFALKTELFKRAFTAKEKTNGI